MSRISRWKPEKTKTKVVFRLQFHATHVPQSGWDKLFITFIPADSGKVTAKTTKANVRNGTCKWADPIYETTRLLQDIKTRQFDEKIYKFVVAMGSSRASLLGEASINLADYADALKPSSVALPLNGCDSGAILHVTVQLLTSKTGFREFEQQRELRERGLLTTSDQNNRGDSIGRLSTSSGETVHEHVENSRFVPKPKSRDHPSCEEEVILNEDNVESSIGFDGSSNTSESLYTEKHETSSTHEIDSLTPEKAEPSDQRYAAHGTSDWIHNWGSDLSAESDLAIAHEENTRLRGSLEVAEASLNELKMEVSSLQNHADELGAEAQRFAHQLAAEMASGENLVREVAILKSECSKFKGELEVLKDSRLMSIGNNLDPMSQDMQLRWLKGLLLMEDKLRELQDKACFGFHDRDLRVLGSDLEAMLILLQDLKQGTGQAVSRLNFVPSEVDSSSLESDQHISRFGFGTDLYQPEGMLQQLSIPALPQESNLVELTKSMENRIDELMRELSESKDEKEVLTKKMDQMECYYEALVQELEGNQRHMLGELQNLRNEHSACLYAVSSTNAEMERMHQDMNDKLLILTEEKRELDILNKELERRATTAEAALKRARLNYSIAVSQLQKDLELLSSQVSSMYEANENLIKQAFEDPAEPGIQGAAENVQKDVLPFKSRPMMLKKQHTGGDVLLDNMRRSLHLQEELYRKVEDEVQDMHLENVKLDVFSKTLQETLLEVVANYELIRKACASLRLKVQNAMDEVQCLNEDKTNSSARCNEMILQIERLESKLQDVTNENCSLKNKMTELDSLIVDCRNFGRKYEISAAENIKLENLLKMSAQECDVLRKENVSLQEPATDLSLDVHELKTVKEDLQNVVNTLQEKLHDLLIFHYENNNGMPSPSLTGSGCRDITSQSLDLFDLVQKLRELQHAACQKITMLTAEVEEMVKQRDAAQVSWSASETVKGDLQKIVDDVHKELRDLLMCHYENGNRLSSTDSESLDMSSLGILDTVSRLRECQQSTQEMISQLLGETNVLVKERDAAQVSLVTLKSVNHNLQKFVNEIQGRLQDLFTAYLEDFDDLSLLGDFDSKDVASMDLLEIVAQLQRFQHTAKQKISHLQGENEVLAKERDAAHVSLATSESAKENLQKYGNELQVRLWNMLVTQDEKFDCTTTSFSSGSDQQDIASKDLPEIVSHLRDFQDNARQRIFELQQENKILVKERDNAQGSLTALESLKENMDKHVNDVEDRLRSLLMCYDKYGDDTSFSKDSIQRDVASTSLIDIVSQLGEFLQSAGQKISQLRGQNVVLLKERDAAQVACSTSESSRENLLKIVNDLQLKLPDLLMCYYKTDYGTSLSDDFVPQDMVAMDVLDIVPKLAEIQQNACQKISHLIEENKALVKERDAAHVSLSTSESNGQHMKQKFEHDLLDMLDRIDKSNSLVDKLQLELEVMADRLRVCSEAEDKYEEEQRQLLIGLSSFKTELDQLTSRNGELEQEILSLRSLSEEVEKSKLTIAEYVGENHVLVASLQSKTEESARLELDLIGLRKSFQSMEGDLQTERSYRYELENKIAELKSQLDQNKSLLLNLSQQDSELVRLREEVSHLESEKETICNLLSEREEYVKLACEESRSINNLEDQLFEMHGHFIAAEVELLFSRAQYDDWIKNVGQRLNFSERSISDLNEKHLDVERRLNCCLANEARYAEENEKLLGSLMSVRCDLEASVAETRVLSSRNDSLMSELKEHRKTNEVAQSSFAEERRKHAVETERLLQRLRSMEEELDTVMVFNEEMEVQLLMLRAKVEEQYAQMTLLQRNCDELTLRLSDQNLKTEEFKNLSTHLKELKDKAEAECLQAQEKKEAESPPFAVQESLRIAFIKEQCDTKVQELKQQLSISKKHGEELLLKLQDSVDELENRKRNEASSLKRNEELSMRILDLEAELQEVISERRERMNAYDCMKAEMECSLISLECCKEEKQKLEDRLRECNEEKSKTAAEFMLVKELLENSKSTLKRNINGSDNIERKHSAVPLEDDERRIYAFACSSPAIEGSIDRNTIENLVILKDENGIQNLALANGESFLQSDTGNAALVNDHFKVEGLRSSMDNLNKELEKMKNENWHLDHDDQADPKFPDLERELVRLDKANKELGFIYPLFNDFAGSGNALERVLALELELAEALLAKKKSSIQFQSSFLRQHSDEEAIFKSFKDINEVIRDMIDLKGKYAAVESELKEMHGRYSQLSLQFAEVEGERQKLMMTLKCVRSSKKALNLNRSSSASLGDH